MGSSPEGAGEGPEVYQLARSFPAAEAVALVEGTLGLPVEAIRRNEVAGSHAVFFAKVAGGGECVLRVATHPEHDLALELWAEAQGRAAGVPVPPLLIAEVEPRAGVFPFALSRRAPGETAHGAELSLAERTAVFEQLGRYAARIHRVPVRGFGALRPDGIGEYAGTDSSLAEWAERDRDECLQMLAALPSPPLTPAQIETIHALFVAVRDALDLPTAVLAHGDFRFKNVLLEGGCVTAVLDFEMALAGDPAQDLAWLLHSDSEGEAEQEALFRGYLAEVPEGIGEGFPQRLAWYRLRYALIELWWAACFGEAEPAQRRVLKCLQALEGELR